MKTPDEIAREIAETGLLAILRKRGRVTDADIAKHTAAIAAAIREEREAREIADQYYEEARARAELPDAWEKARQEARAAALREAAAVLNMFGIGETLRASMRAAILALIAAGASLRDKEPTP